MRTEGSTPNFAGIFVCNSVKGNLACVLTVCIVATCLSCGRRPPQGSAPQGGGPVAARSSLFPNIEWIRGDAGEIDRGGNYHLIGKDSSGSGYFIAYSPLSLSLSDGIVDRTKSIRGVRSWVADTRRYPNLGFADESATRGVPLSKEERVQALGRSVD